VLGLAMIFAFFCLNTNKDGEDHLELDDDEDYLHSTEVCRLVI